MPKVAAQTRQIKTPDTWLSGGFFMEREMEMTGKQNR